MKNTTKWKGLLFRVIGVVCVIGGFFVLYDFGKDILPLFTRFVRGTNNFFEIFTVLIPFVFAAPAFFLVGGRLVFLRSLSPKWLYFVTLPFPVWLQQIYDIGLLFEMDEVLSLGVFYLFSYILILKIVLFVHTHWYTPLSHENMRYVRLVKPDGKRSPLVPWALATVALVGLLILHEEDILTTLEMIISPIHYLFQLL